MRTLLTALFSLAILRGEVVLRDTFSTTGRGTLPARLELWTPKPAKA